MVDIDLKRAKKTKRRNNPDKFINDNFAIFLNNAFPLEEGNEKRDVITFSGWDSLDEWVNHFQLEQKHGIPIDAIIKLLDDKGCILEFNKKEGFLKYHN